MGGLWHCFTHINSSINGPRLFHIYVNVDTKWLNTSSFCLLACLLACNHWSGLESAADVCHSHVWLRTLAGPARLTFEAKNTDPKWPCDPLKGGLALMGQISAKTNRPSLMGLQNASCTLLCMSSRESIHIFNCRQAVSMDDADKIICICSCAQGNGMTRVSDNKVMRNRSAFFPLEDALIICHAKKSRATSFPHLRECWH